MLECVPNVSEGRATDAIDAFTAACGDALLDVHRDPDHHRSVFTLAGPGDRAAEVAVRTLAAEVVSRVDLDRHEGVHPRLGALDVVPFVALDDAADAVAVDAAHDFGAWAVDALGAPVFFYGHADERQRSLPSTRSTAFRTRAPDLEPRTLRPGVGAIAVGARPVLIAVNCELDRDDRSLAVALARDVREQHSGGLPGVRALGFRLSSRARVQVSMNLVDLARTGIERACTEVRDRARAAGADVAHVELVGLAPGAELARCSDAFLAWSGLGPDQTIESRLALPLSDRSPLWRR